MEVSRNKRRKMNSEKTRKTVTPMVVGLDRKVSRHHLEPDARKAICKSPPHPKAVLDAEIKRRFRHATIVPVRKADIKAAGYCCDGEFIQWQLAQGRGVQIQEHELCIWFRGKQLDDYMAANADVTGLAPGKEINHE